jgi:hypothetical protein
MSCHGIVKKWFEQMLVSACPIVPMYLLQAMITG